MQKRKSVGNRGGGKKETLNFNVVYSVGSLDPLGTNESRPFCSASSKIASIASS